MMTSIQNICKKIKIKGDMEWTPTEQRPKSQKS